MVSDTKILICDDDELLVDLLEHRLSARGFDVLVARDGGEAVAAASEQKPDVIVLDAMMPVMDGYEVLRRLRSRDETAAIPVIMLTLDALELGARDYLVKPFLPDELTTRLNG